MCSNNLLCPCPCHLALSDCPRFHSLTVSLSLSMSMTQVRDIPSLPQETAFPCLLATALLPPHSLHLLPLPLGPTIAAHPHNPLFALHIQFLPYPLLAGLPAPHPHDGVGLQQHHRRRPPLRLWRAARRARVRDRHAQAGPPKTGEHGRAVTGTDSDQDTGSNSTDTDTDTD
jgi:hypothetical protein